MIWCVENELVGRAMKTTQAFMLWCRAKVFELKHADNLAIWKLHGSLNKRESYVLLFASDLESWQPVTHHRSRQKTLWSVKSIWLFGSGSTCSNRNRERPLLDILASQEEMEKWSKTCSMIALRQIFFSCEYLISQWKNCDVRHM